MGDGRGNTVLRDWVAKCVMGGGRVGAGIRRKAGGVKPPLQERSRPAETLCEGFSWAQAGVRGAPDAKSRSGDRRSRETQERWHESQRYSAAPQRREGIICGTYDTGDGD